MTSYQFKSVAKVVKRNSFEGLQEELSLLCKSPIVVCGHSLDRYNLLCKAINLPNPSPIQVSKEPIAEEIELLRSNLSKYEIDGVIGIGGGSVLDTAKALAALIPQDGVATDYLEIVGKGLPLEKHPLPTILIPTTSGTGSEATKNAVIEATDSQRKVSLRSEKLFANLVWLNPNLTLSQPAHVTAHCGFDALTQLLEAYVSNKSTPFTDLYCEKGLAYCANSIEKTFTNPKDLKAREEMQLASFYSGIALANGGLGAVHGFAAPLGALLHAPHGAICASLLYQCTKENIAALQKDSKESIALQKYERAAKQLTRNSEASCSDLLNWISDLTENLKIKSMKSYGLNEEKALKAVKSAQESNSMKGNPVLLSEDTLSKILLNAS